ncbi:hypothetical protein EAE99_004255 [Botrytis elliptica]|nr:hypothetical protein EAE99_004255 [Botrytis elliptica]
MRAPTLLKPHANIESKLQPTNSTHFNLQSPKTRQDSTNQNGGGTSREYIQVLPSCHIKEIRFEFSSGEEEIVREGYPYYFKKNNGRMVMAGMRAGIRGEKKFSVVVLEFGEGYSYEEFFSSLRSVMRSVMGN